MTGTASAPAVPASHVPVIMPLTSIRFTAALLVILLHAAPADLTGPRALTLFGKLASIGYIGVGIFFVLSGFILGTVYGPIKGSSAAIDFYIKRIARIYPLYAFSLLCDVPRVLTWCWVRMPPLTAIAITAKFFFAQLLALHAVFPSLGALNFPTWSLGNELIWYIAFPLIAPALLGLRQRRSRWLALLVCYGLALAPPIAVTASGWEPAADDLSWLKYSPLLRLPEFAAGIVLAGLYAQRRQNAQGAGALLMVIASVAAIGIVAQFAGQLPMLAIHNGLLLPAYLSLIYGLACAKGVLAQAMSLSPLVLLGEASYSMYLLHIPILQLFEMWTPLSSAPMFLLYVLTVIAASIAAHYAIERPCRALITGWAQSWQSRRSVLAAGGTPA